MRFFLYFSIICTYAMKRISIQGRFSKTDGFLFFSLKYRKIKLYEQQESEGGEEEMKVLASDFDGTICFWQKEEGQSYRNEDVEAIRRFQEEGNLFGLNTGRSVWTTDNIHEKTNGVIPFDFIIGDTGSVIADQNRVPFFSRPLDPDLIFQAIEAAGSDSVVFSTENGYMALRDLGGEFPHQVIENREALRNMTICSFSFEEPTHEQAAAVAERLRNSGLPLSVNQNWQSVDVCDQSCSKGNALKILADHYSLQLKDIAAIGDGLNDLPAIQKAGIGFAMKQAPEQLHDAADYTVESVREAIEILEKIDAAEKETEKSCQSSGSQKAD